MTAQEMFEIDCPLFCAAVKQFFIEAQGQSIEGMIERLTQITGYSEGKVKRLCSELREYPTLIKKLAPAAVEEFK